MSTNSGRNIREKDKGSAPVESHHLASRIDYMGIASLIYMGADALFKKFAVLRNTWMAAAATAQAAAAPGILKDDIPGPGDKKLISIV